MPFIGRITITDDAFVRLITGETLTLDVRPDTAKVQLQLDPGSQYRKSYSDILSELKKAARLYSRPASR